MNQLPNPIVAAVHQTLAGERLTYQVQFPATGDPDCDFIQGILAVVKAVDLATPPCTARVLRYLLERFNSQDQPVPNIEWERSIQAAVDRAVYEQQHRFQLPVHQSQPWNGITPGGLGQVASGTVPMPHPQQFLVQVQQALDQQTCKRTASHD